MPKPVPPGGRHVVGHQSRQILLEAAARSVVLLIEGPPKAGAGVADVTLADL